MNILVISDLHSGSNYALSPEKYISNSFQRWVYEKYQLLVNNVKNLDYLVTLGDMVDGSGKHDSTSNWTTDVHKQANEAINFLKPFVQKNTKVIGVSGSGYHYGKGTGFDGDRLVVEGLGGDYKRTYQIGTPFGVIQFYHVAKNIKTEANNIRINNAEFDEKVAWYIAGHQHRYEEYAAGRVKVRHCPCWQYPTDFMEGFGVNTSVDIGCLLIKVDDLGIYTRDIRFPIPLEVKKEMSGWVEITAKQIEQRNKKDMEKISQIAGISPEIVKSIKDNSILRIDVPQAPDSPEVKVHKKQANRIDIPKI